MTEPQPAKQAPYGVQMLLGAASFLLLLVGIGWLVLALALMRQNPLYLGLNISLSLIPTGLGVLLLVRRSRRGRGLAVGFLLSLGILALAAGICVAILRQGL